jgi:hypothetical protein
VVTGGGGGGAGAAAHPPPAPPGARRPPRTKLGREALATPCSPLPLSPPNRRPLPYPHQAARDIAATIAGSANRVYLNAESLMLNLSDIQGLAKK